MVLGLALPHSSWPGAEYSRATVRRSQSIPLRSRRLQSLSRRKTAPLGCLCDGQQLDLGDLGALQRWPAQLEVGIRGQGVSNIPAHDEGDRDQE